MQKFDAAGPIPQIGVSHAGDNRAGRAVQKTRRHGSLDPAMIQLVLRETPYLDKRQVRTALREAGDRETTLGEINKILYGNAILFQPHNREGDLPPLWSIRDMNPKVLILSRIGAWTGATIGRLFHGRNRGRS